MWKYATSDNHRQTLTTSTNKDTITVSLKSSQKNGTAITQNMCFSFFFLIQREFSEESTSLFTWWKSDKAFNLLLTQNMFLKSF